MNPNAAPFVPKPGTGGGAAAPTAAVSSSGPFSTTTVSAGNTGGGAFGVSGGTFGSSASAGEGGLSSGRDAAAAAGFTAGFTNYGNRSATTGSNNGAGQGLQVTNGGLNRTAKLFVGQLPFECDEQRLYELFGAYGTVTQIHILRDQSDKSRGAAFVTYSCVEEADTAIFTLHRRYRMLTNRSIQVSYAKNSANISRYGTLAAYEVHFQNASNPMPDLTS